MNLTIKDVASRAGVSTATVSRVINGSGYFSDATKQKVLSAIEELNYTPDIIAKGLASNQMRIIGVIVPDICNTFFSEIFYAASKLARQHDYRVILYNTDDNIMMENDALQDMLRYRVSGIIMTPVSDTDITNVDLLKSIQEVGIPIVFVDREMKDINCDCVFVDNIRSSYEATKLLLDEGHRDIAVIIGPLDTVPGRERFAGFTNALNDWGLEIRSEYVLNGDFKAEKSYQKTIQLLESESPPTAFFSCNNLMTLGCIKAIRSFGKRIPENIALIGFDEIEILDILGYEITVVSRATAEMGTVAMQLLLERIKKQKNGLCQRVILQSFLKIKGSEKRCK